VAFSGSNLRVSWRPWWFSEFRTLPVVPWSCDTVGNAIGWCSEIQARSGCTALGQAAEEVSMQLKITKRTVDGILVFECSGRIVFGDESSQLRDEVKKGLQENKRIVLNLAEVNYIDSGGLGTLVSLHTTAHNAGATIKLANLTKRVGDLLQVTKLLTVFDVRNSEREALESFGKEAVA
jgi:anti-sigma B factor antagonist